MVAETLFFITVLLLAVTYVIYPLLTIAVAALKQRNNYVSADLPMVTILMPMYNEEKVAKAKTESLLALDYPAGHIEIILGSDASTDSTDEIISAFASKSEMVRIVRSDVRLGKAGMLNLMVKQAHGEILVVTDANVIPSPDCLRLIASHFHDTKTGICDAWPITRSDDSKGITAQEKIYSSFEMRLKNAEGNAWGTMTGLYGGFYAIRKELFPLIPEKILVDDLYAVLNVISKGFNAINEEKAVVIEDIPPDVRGQFRRRIRIAAGSFQNLFYWGPLPGGIFSGASYSFFIHKVIRWFSPLLIIIFFMTTVILSNHSLFYFAVVFGQIIFLFLSILDILLLKAGITIKPLRFTTQFLMMNAALLAGMIKAIMGVKKGIWEPTQRV